MMKTLLRILLVLTNGFLALTAIAGGIGLLSDLNAPPVSNLAGSAFRDYTIPGLALLVVVGGTAVFATLLTARKHALAVYASAVAGAGIVIFEVVEVLAIGSPPGIARALQLFYFSLGGLILALSLVGWVVWRRAGTAV
jgi:hypothetical protein